MLIITLGAGLAVVLVSLLGILVVVNFARSFVEDRLPYLVSFSAGVFLVTAGALALEVFHVVESLLFGAGLIVLGYVGAWLLHILLPETHHHHDSSCSRRHGGARKLLVGDGLHNVADGIILVPAFAASPALGIAVMGSIMVHETLQEISKYFVLRAAGYSVTRSIVLCVAVSSTILLGVVFGYVILQTAVLEGVLLAVSSGFLLHVVAHDLLPTRQQHPLLPDLLWQMGAVAVGVTLMVGIAWAVEDVHVHGDDHQHGVEDGHGHDHDHNDEHRHDLEEHDDHENEHDHRHHEESDHEESHGHTH